jgi:hypothetical protein
MQKNMTTSTGHLLHVPYFCQLDNTNNPYGSCNVTAMAMALSYYGIIGNGQGQLEDQLYQRMSDRGLDHGLPEDMASLINDEYGNLGIRDSVTRTGTWKDVTEAIIAGHPTIVHGWFTQSGHIVLIKGYSDKGYLINDPYGEWFADGYRTDLSGQGLLYSYDLMNRICGPDGQIWLHVISKATD